MLASKTYVHTNQKGCVVFFSCSLSFSCLLQAISLYFSSFFWPVSTSLARLLASVCDSVCDICVWLTSVEPFDGFVLLLNSFTKLLHLGLILLWLHSRWREDFTAVHLKQQNKGFLSCRNVRFWTLHLCGQLFYPPLLLVDLTHKVLLLLQQTADRLPQLWWDRKINMT